MLTKAGYRPRDIMVFMLCNWKIPYSECMKKLDLLKVWNVQVCDCYFDNQIKNIPPVYWSKTRDRRLEPQMPEAQPAREFQDGPGGLITYRGVRLRRGTSALAYT